MQQHVTTFSDLIAKIAASGKNNDEKSLERINKAYALAAQAHSGQKRKSGEPYISHPVAVAGILVELGMDADSLITGLLHDVVEDTDISLKFIEDEFGETVAKLVDSVTKLGQVALTTKEDDERNNVDKDIMKKKIYSFKIQEEDNQRENIRKILIAMSEDIRVIIIKLSDRLHNMRTLGSMSKDKQLRISKETLEVYAPIAHRYGMISIKEEIEDIAIGYLDPHGYRQIEQKLEEQQDDRDAFLEKMRKKLQKKIDEAGIEAEIFSRVKSIYGIYRKEYMQGKLFEQIHDVYAMRVIVDTVAECYAVLGLVHGMFQPIMNNFKDYISIAKPNSYQSLHTTVMEEGIPFEIQIRTWAMNHTAEIGVAAHWKYKDGVEGEAKSYEENVNWIKAMVESDIDGMESIISALKTDLVPEEIYVFTPMGEVKTLPVGATIVDFAYSIHSEVGNKMVGAKANKKITSLDTLLQGGDIIEILTTKNADHGPSKNWIALAKTSEARNKIRGWFKREKRDENIEEGKSELEKEFKRNNIKFENNKDTKEFLELIAKKQSCSSIDDFYAKIGYSGIQLSKIMPRIREEYREKHIKTKEAEIIYQKDLKPSNQRYVNSVIVEGEEGVSIRFPKCCEPLVGEDIIGYITRGYGVSIHKSDCINVVKGLNDPKEADRWVKANWAENAAKISGITFVVRARNREGLIGEVSLYFTSKKIKLLALSGKALSTKDEDVVLVTVEISSMTQLESIKNGLKSLKGVISVERGLG